MQLYYDYYIHEYGDINSDYVFVNLWKGKIGAPMSYHAVMTLFQRLRPSVYVEPVFGQH